MRHNLEFLYKENWFAEINDSEKNPMLRLYKSFKKSFCLENYIKDVANRHTQKCISKFRLSSHNLRIHTGRQKRDKMGNKTPAEKRFCLSCKSNKIDDELHLLTTCITHNDERQKLFSNISNIIDLHCSQSNLLSHVKNNNQKDK